jgi:Family of unknown function (DUF6931)
MVRFETPQALFEVFPEARTFIRVEPSEEPSLQFLRKLATNGKLEDAVTFCSYILRRRDAVWWACRSIRAFLGEPILAKFDQQPLALAEAWVQQPEEERRLAAQQAASRGDPDSPTTWVANSAAWAGGAYSVGNIAPIAPPQQLTAHAATVAILLCSRRIGMPKSGIILRACIAEGAELAGLLAPS